MNQKQTLSAIRALGLTAARTAAGEYRITPGGEASAYYTTDADDALATARAFAAAIRDVRLQRVSAHAATASFLDVSPDPISNGDK